MEGNKLSLLAQEFLDQIHNDGVLQCALQCVGISEWEDETDLESLLHSELSKSLANSLSPVYLNESTAHHKDPLKSAQKALQMGYLSQGIRIELESPMNWGKFSVLSRNVRYKVQAWLVLDAVLNFDSLEKSDEMYESAFSHILDWINCFIIDSQDDDFAWYDMAVGQRATKLAYIIRRAIEEDEAVKDIAALIVTAELHIRELMEEEKIAMHSNHGLFQMAGLLALGESLPFLSLSNEASKFAIGKIRTMLEDHFTEDYLHKEHSPMYHIFMANYVSLLLNSGFMAESIEFTHLAEGAIEAAKWFAMPNGNILPFGDTPKIPITERTNFELNLVRDAAVSPPGLKYFKKGGLVIHSHYSESEMPQSYLAFNGGFHSRQHKHADDFNIQLFGNGVDILVDPGTFTYQYDLPERMYIESTRAHNCLEIDGLNYSRFRKDAFGSAITSVTEVGDCLIIEAEIERKSLVSPQIPHNKVKNEDAVEVEINHGRKIVYCPGDFMLVLDCMSSAQPHVYRQWFQMSPQLSLSYDGGSEAFISTKEGKPVAKMHQLFPVNGLIKIFEGTVKPELQGWVSTDGHTLEKTASVCIESEGASQIIATVFDLNPTKQATYFFNEGTGGKYLRFTLKRAGSTFEFISRTKGDSTEITLSDSTGTHTI
jgi:hypothetical protein